MRPPTKLTESPSRPDLAVPLRDGLIAAALSLAIYYGGFYLTALTMLTVAKRAFGVALPMNHGHPVFAISLLVGATAAASFAFSRLRRFGWNAIGRPSRRDVAAFAAAVVAVIILGYAYQVFTRIAHVVPANRFFDHFSVRDPNPIVMMASIVATLVGACVCIPLFEEAMSRALIFGSLLPRLTKWGAAAMSAAIFAAIHRDPIGFPFLFGYGFIATTAYAATRNLTVPIALHLTTNATLIGMAIVTSLATHR